MKKLIEYTKILRSKNAGPLYITFDLIFYNREDMEYVAQRLKKEVIAAAYNADADKVEIISYAVVNSIKITFPRSTVSGNLDDNDIYGCQQHMPLANIEIE